MKDKPTDNIDVMCPECGNRMGKSGFVWSGRNKRVRMRCYKCGRTTMIIPVNKPADTP